MKLALVSDSVVEKSHGTGNLLLRLLESAPITVSYIYPGELAATAPQAGFVLKRRPTAAATLDSWRRRVPAGAFLLPAPRPGARRWRYSIDGGARASLAAADLVLGVVHTTDGLDLVEDCLAGLSAQKPAVLWFMDLQISPGEADSTRLPAGARLWALNAQIKAGLEKLFPLTSSPIEERMFVGVKMPPAATRKFRPLSTGTRCVMIGNIWDTSALPRLNAVWTEACERHGHNLPIRWYAPPEAFARVPGGASALGPAVRYEGHAPDLDLVLSESDVAIAAFSGTSPAAALYRRYSFPSRVADYAANGLPVFAICDDDTALADYLTESGAGVFAAPDSVTDAAAVCARFLASVTEREACSIRARHYAESHFDLGQQREQFVAALAAALPAGHPSARMRHS